MIHVIGLKPSFTTECGRKLLFNRRYRRTVKTSSACFEALHETRKCTIHGIYGSENLESMVTSHCTYGNDIIIDAAMNMFIDERSSSEGAFIKSTVISSRHVRRLASMALSIFQEIHYGSTEIPMKSMA